jgi:hypothetical protein
MFSFNTDGFLRRILFTDAATCAVCGLFMVATAAPFGEATRIPRELLVYAGVTLFPIAAFMAFVASRAARSMLAVRAVVVGNLAWAAASFWLMASGVIAPTWLGQLFLAGQALVVLVLTTCEAIALRRAVA